MLAGLLSSTSRIGNLPSNRVLNLELTSIIIVASIYGLLVFLYTRLRPLMKPPKSRMVIYKDLCNGCGNCVVICPSNALRSQEVQGGKGPRGWEVVMKIEDGNVLEFNMDLCERVTKLSEDPCRLCIEACPLNAIDFTY